MSSGGTAQDWVADSGAAVARDYGAAVQLLEEVLAVRRRTLGNDHPDTLDSITNAGAIFLGADSPVSLGDYLAGSNHVLPTGGQSRFSAGLGASTFLRSQQIIRYTHEGLQEVAPLVASGRRIDHPYH